MKGVIFNVVQEAVEEAHGAEAWDAILEKAGLDGAYTSLGNYASSQLLDIVAAAAQLLNTSPEEIVLWAGKRAFHGLAARYPDQVAVADNLRDFLPKLNDIIHPEVLKLYPDSHVPYFALERLDEDAIDLVYQSRRDLPLLAAGLALGASEFYGEDWRFDSMEPAASGTLLRLRR